MSNNSFSWAEFFKDKDVRKLILYLLLGLSLPAIGYFVKSQIIIVMVSMVGFVIAVNSVKELQSRIPKDRS